MNKKSVTQKPVPILPPYSSKMNERVPQLFAFRLALSYQKKPRFFSQGLNAAECGVYQGYSLLSFAQTSQLLKYKVNFYGLDSFAGFPQLSEDEKSMINIDPKLNIDPQVLFQDTSIEQVQKLLADNGIRRTKLYKGFFKDTLPLLPEKKYFFVNIDCDLYEPHIECLNYFYPRLVKQGMLYFDDYHSIHYPQARKAIDEFVLKNKLTLSHIRFGEEKANHTKTFIIKP